MSVLVPDVFDSDEVLAGVFSNPMFAAEFAYGFTCTEVNALVGQLESHGRHRGAAAWLGHHLPTCLDQRRHLN